MRSILYAGIAGAILGVPGPVLWLMNYVFGHHYLADGSGVLERLLPFFPLFILLLMIPSSDPAVPATYLGGFLIALLANMTFFAAVAAFGAAIIIGAFHLIGLFTK